jgi:hypothetical protein
VIYVVETVLLFFATLFTVDVACPLNKIAVKEFCLAVIFWTALYLTLRAGGQL